jgi:hypothetical protein
MSMAVGYASMSSQFAAAVIAGGVSIVVALLSAFLSERSQERRLRAELDGQKERVSEELHDQRERLHAELESQRERLRAELRTEFMAEEALRSLLEHPTWKYRSFDAIRKKVRGFDDDELRRLLIRSGALCFELRADKREMWGLRSRNEDKVTQAASDDESPMLPAA